ncbi:hypothetical protein ABK040_015628 [Willaertia magna]
MNSSPVHNESSNNNTNLTNTHIPTVTTTASSPSSRKRATSNQRHYQHNYNNSLSPINRSSSSNSSIVNTYQDEEEDHSVIPHHHHHYNSSGQEDIELADYFGVIELMLPPDTLLIIIDYLNDADTIFNLTRVCSVWRRFLDKNETFWRNIYFMKINELRIKNYKDFDLYVQERVIANRLKKQSPYKPVIESLIHITNNNEEERIGGSSGGATYNDIYNNNALQPLDKDIEITPLVVHQVKYTIPLLSKEQVFNNNPVLNNDNFYKDCFLTLRITETKFNVLGRGIFRRAEQQNEIRLIPLKDEIKLEKLNNLSAWNRFIGYTTFCLLSLCTLIGIIIKGINEELGNVYESNWTWSLVFIPIFLICLLFIIFTLMKLKIAIVKFRISNQVFEQNPTREEAIVMKKEGYEELLFTIFLNIMSFLFPIFCILFCLYLSLPHYYIGKTGWISGIYLMIMSTIGLFYLLITNIYKAILFWDNHISMYNIGNSKPKKIFICCGQSSIQIFIYILSIIMIILFANQLTIGYSMEWYYVLIPIFIIEFVFFIAIFIINILWFKFEYKKASKKRRFLFILLFILLYLIILLFVIHHILICIPNLGRYGFVTIVLLPIPSILLPAILILIYAIRSIQSNYIWKLQEEEMNRIVGNL